MTRFTTSRGCTWAQPRQPLDTSMRFHAFGKVLPMEEPVNVRRELVGGAAVFALVGLVLAGLWIVTP